MELMGAAKRGFLCLGGHLGKGCNFGSIIEDGVVFGK